MKENTASFIYCESVRLLNRLQNLLSPLSLEKKTEEHETEKEASISIHDKRGVERSNTSLILNLSIVTCSLESSTWFSPCYNVKMLSDREIFVTSERGLKALVSPRLL